MGKEEEEDGEKLRRDQKNDKHSYKNQFTSPLCVHSIPGGGSGKCLTMQVKLTVEPASIYKSGPPTIVVIGSTYKKQHRNLQFKAYFI